jgi:hypothetical protein
MEDLKAIEVPGIVHNFDDIPRTVHILSIKNIHI